MNWWEFYYYDDLDFDIELYRDDSVILLCKVKPQKTDWLRIELIKFFKDHELSITTTTNTKVTNFLDVTLDLNNGCYKPYTKDLCNIKYVSKLSNHPKTILDNLHKSVQFRLSTNSSNKDVFDKAKTKHTEALELSHHKVNLEYLDLNKEGNKKRKHHKCRIIWFNPPFSHNIKTNIRRFFSKLNKH